MPRLTTMMLAIAGLSLASFGASALSGSWLSGSWPAPEQANPAIDRNQAAREAPMTTGTSNPTEFRATAQAKASASSRASASASATASSDGQADCATEATATAESDGERITVRESRRSRGEQGGCTSAAQATSGDVSSGVGRE